MKVLIGEEDRASRTILEKTMNVMNHKVKAVEDPDELMDVLDKKKDVDIVFLGMKLKGKSGLDLTKDILEKKIDNRPYTILVASEDQDIDLIGALENGSDDFLLKPLNEEKIKSRMKKAKTSIEVERRGLKVKPLDDLKKEHELLRRMINILEVAQFRIKEEVPEKVLNWIGSASLTLDQEVHHKKETYYLISFIENATEEQGEAERSKLFSRASLKQVEEEHDKLERMVKEIQKKVKGYKEGKVSTGEIRNMLRDYKELMRDHLRREERFLFPLSSKYIDEDTAEELMVRFDKIEEKAGYDKLEKFEQQISKGEETLYIT
ncbi:MAG: response regulator [Thermoplasmatota archaeon]